MDGGADYFSMFLLGVLGSGHCLGMCGPLVVALPGRYTRWHAHWIYHAGRIGTYAMVGAALGGLGRGVIRLAATDPSAALVWMARTQIGLSLVAALLLLLLGLGRLGLLREPRWMAVADPQKIPGYDDTLKRVLNRGNALWLLAMGLMLGLLPCGLSYAAFARALAAGGASRGAWMTICFGLGTLPGLMLLGSGAARLLHRYRTQADLLSGLVMIGMALSLSAKAWTAAG